MAKPALAAQPRQATEDWASVHVRTGHENAPPRQDLGDGAHSDSGDSYKVYSLVGVAMLHRLSVSLSYRAVSRCVEGCIRWLPAWPEPVSAFENFS